MKYIQGFRKLKVQITFLILRPVQILRLSFISMHYTLKMHGEKRYSSFIHWCLSYRLQSQKISKDDATKFLSGWNSSIQRIHCTTNFRFWTRRSGRETSRVRSWSLDIILSPNTIIQPFDGNKLKRPANTQRNPAGANIREQILEPMNISNTSI